MSSRAVCCADCSKVTVKALHRTLFFLSPWVEEWSSGSWWIWCSAWLRPMCCHSSSWCPLLLRCLGCLSYSDLVLGLPRGLGSRWCNVTAGIEVLEIYFPGSHKNTCLKVWSFGVCSQLVRARVSQQCEATKGCASSLA